jgi:hypothetical protein
MSFDGTEMVLRDSTTAHNGDPDLPAFNCLEHRFPFISINSKTTGTQALGPLTPRACFLGVFTLSRETRHKIQSNYSTWIIRLKLLFV